MRRNYISPEFNKTNVNGTFNMVEESNFFSAKMLEIEDSILISNENIIWFQRPNGEQLDFDTETTMTPKTFSSSGTKLVNHKIYRDDTQTQYTLDNATKWIIDLDIQSILSTYIFAQMKNNRTFEGIKTSMTVFNNLDIALNKYIEFNVLNRYRMSKFDLFIKYVDLKEQNVLRFNNKWNDKIGAAAYMNNKFETVSDFEGKTLRVIFNQEKPSTLYNFEYFFNILYEKI
jgi:hypothetical protein